MQRRLFTARIHLKHRAAAVNDATWIATILRGAIEVASFVAHQSVGRIKSILRLSKRVKYPKRLRLCGWRNSGEREQEQDKPRAVEPLCARCFRRGIKYQGLDLRDCERPSVLDQLITRDETQAGRPFRFAYMTARRPSG